MALTIRLTAEEQNQLNQVLQNSSEKTANKLFVKMLFDYPATRRELELTRAKNHELSNKLSRLKMLLAQKKEYERLLNEFI